MRLVVVVLTCALFACKQGKKTSDPTPPCATWPKKPSLDLYVCSEAGGRENTELVGRDGQHQATLPGGTKVVRLYAQPDNAETRTRAGIAEVRVCVLDSTWQGNVGYVPSTRIFGRPCE